ncbi:MAG TPA: hypothetical protein VFY65_07935 [Longimicrobium sp.]|nr:hypothetical protein [Longimicrobium sp.]
MPKGARAKSPTASPAASSSAVAADHASIIHRPQPFTARPLLLGVLSTVFVAWLAFLVYLYVTTVYPHRSVAPTTAVSALVLPVS